jgi:S-adenosylmethionine decarboxylase
MRMTVGLALYSGIEHSKLDSCETMEEVLRLAVVAGGFSLHDLRMVKFEPQGVTGAAIVGESHLTVHTWPEEGRLFVDVASCSSLKSVEQALAAVERFFDGAKILSRQIVELH